jgi:hypothetical protein
MALLRRRALLQKQLESTTPPPEYTDPYWGNLPPRLFGLNYNYYLPYAETYTISGQDSPNNNVIFYQRFPEFFEDDFGINPGQNPETVDIYFVESILKSAIPDCSHVYPCDSWNQVFQRSDESALTMETYKFSNNNIRRHCIAQYRNFDPYTARLINFPIWCIFPRFSYTLTFWVEDSLNLPSGVFGNDAGIDITGSGQGGHYPTFVGKNQGLNPANSPISGWRYNKGYVACDLYYVCFGYEDYQYVASVDSNGTSQSYKEIGFDWNILLRPLQEKASELCFLSNAINGFTLRGDQRCMGLSLWDGYLTHQQIQYIYDNVIV